MPVQYALKSDQQSDQGAANRLFEMARREGTRAGSFAPDLKVDYDKVVQAAKTVFARHCGDGDNAGKNGIVFRWRDGGTFVDDWQEGSDLFVSAYTDGYLNACLKRAAKGVPLIAVPLVVSGATGVLRLASEQYTALVRLDAEQEPFTARSSTAFGAVQQVIPMIAHGWEPCVATGQSGTVCRQPGTIYDDGRGGMVCADHAPVRKAG